MRKGSRKSTLLRLKKINSTEHFDDLNIDQLLSEVIFATKNNIQQASEKLDSLIQDHGPQLSFKQHNQVLQCILKKKQDTRSALQRSHAMQRLLKFKYIEKLQGLLTPENFEAYCMSAKYRVHPADKTIYEINDELEGTYCLLSGQIFEMIFDIDYQNYNISQDALKEIDVDKFSNFKKKILKINTRGLFDENFLALIRKRLNLPDMETKQKILNALITRELDEESIFVIYLLLKFKKLMITTKIKDFEHFGELYFTISVKRLETMYSYSECEMVVFPKHVYQQKVAKALNLYEKNMIRQLQNFSLFKDFTLVELSVVLSYCEIVPMRYKQVVLEKDQFSLFVFLVKQGEVSVTKNKKVLHYVSPNQLFGEECFLDGVNVQCTYKCSQQGELIRMNCNTLLRCQLAVSFKSNFIKELRLLNNQHLNLRQGQNDKIESLPLIFKNQFVQENPELDQQFFGHLSTKHKNKIKHIHEKNAIQKKLLVNLTADARALSNKVHLIDINDYIQDKLDQQKQLKEEELQRKRIIAYRMYSKDLSNIYGSLENYLAHSSKLDIEMDETRVEKKGFKPMDSSMKHRLKKLINPELGNKFLLHSPGREQKNIVYNMQQPSVNNLQPFLAPRNLSKIQKNKIMLNQLDDSTISGILSPSVHSKQSPYKP